MGAVFAVECAATAADKHNTVAMPIRRDGEMLNVLLKRIDKAIGNSKAVMKSLMRSTPRDSGHAVKTASLVAYLESPTFNLLACRQS